MNAHLQLNFLSSLRIGPLSWDILHVQKGGAGWSKSTPIGFLKDLSWTQLTTVNFNLQDNYVWQVYLKIQNTVQYEDSSSPNPPIQSF